MACHTQIIKVNAQLPNILQMLRDVASGGQMELIVLVEVPWTNWVRRTAGKSRKDGGQQGMEGLSELLKRPRRPCVFRPYPTGAIAMDGHAH